MIDGFRKENGFFVPADEIDRAVKRRFRADQQLAAVAGLCRGRKVAVQAGGNWGYWPFVLSRLFETVYTFEPGPKAFSCLAMNTVSRPNVIRLQAALGSGHGTVGIVEKAGASGHTRVEGAGAVPVMRIDDLALASCDLIYLDVEGFEHQALVGGMETIAMCKPVVAFEDKGHSERYGQAKGSCARLLAGLGYQTVARYGHDTVMAC